MAAQRKFNEEKAEHIAHRKALKARDRQGERKIAAAKRRRLAAVRSLLDRQGAADARSEIDHPPHYVKGRKYEPLDVIIDWELPYLEGQVVRYISRAGRKGTRLTDLKKAQFYLNRAIAQIEHGGEDKAKE